MERSEQQVTTPVASGREWSARAPNPTMVGKRTHPAQPDTLNPTMVGKRTHPAPPPPRTRAWSENARGRRFDLHSIWRGAANRG